MKIKIGTVEKDFTSYGNKYFIQIEDSSTNDNEDLGYLIGKKVTVVIGDVKAIDEFDSGN